MKPIDTHTHLLKSMRAYEVDLETNIENNLDKLELIFNVAFDLDTSKEVLELNKKYPKLIPVIGIHPSESNEFKKEDIIELEKLINDNVKAIGETGLDYFHKNVKEKQKQSFNAHIDLANKYNLPICVHCRNAVEDTIEIMVNYPDTKFLLHSWSGEVEETKKLLEKNNFYISFSGVLTFKNAPKIRELLKIAPLDKIVFETDAPWLTPAPFRGKVNYPYHVRETIKFAANELNLSYESLVKISNKNARRFYNI